MSRLGFQKAEFSTSPRSEPITKDAAYTVMSSFAHDYGMKHFDVRFNDTNQNDIIATLSGSKQISTDHGDIIMAFLAEAHWGRGCIFSAIISEPATQHPTPDGMAFLGSIRRVQ